MSKIHKVSKYEVEKIVEMHLNTDPSKKRFSFNKGTLFYRSAEGFGVVIKVGGSSLPFVKKPLSEYTVECLTTRRSFPLPLSLYDEPDLVDILQGEVRRYWDCNAVF